MNSHDMYGHEIVPLGETGYGVSTTFAGQNGSPLWPVFTFFHVSDGFKQCLFMVDIFHLNIPAIHNVFHDRIYEILTMEPHGRLNASNEES